VEHWKRLTLPHLERKYGVIVTARRCQLDKWFISKGDVSKWSTHGLKSNSDMEMDVSLEVRCVPRGTL